MSGSAATNATDHNSASVRGYAVTGCIGAGGMAKVFSAECVGIGGFRRRVAIKRPHREIQGLGAVTEMFCAEAALAAELDHPGVVRVFDFGRDEAGYYMVMELVRGCCIGDLIQHCADSGALIPVDVALNLAAQAARALAFLHDVRDEDGRSRQLVHRDVSSANLLVSLEGYLKLVDFGIARSAVAELPEELRQIAMGSMEYMSPEQAAGGPVDGRSDVYSLAKILTEMLTCRRIFDDGTKSTLETLYENAGWIPEDVLHVLEEALQIDPASRMDAAALADALEALVAHYGGARAATERTAERVRSREALLEDSESAESSGFELPVTQVSERPRGARAWDQLPQ